MNRNDCVCSVQRFDWLYLWFALTNSRNKQPLQPKKKQQQQKHTKWERQTHEKESFGEFYFISLTLRRTKIDCVFSCYTKQKINRQSETFALRITIDTLKVNNLQSIFF